MNYSVDAMEFQERLYQGIADQAGMLELARRYPAQHLRVLDLPYRLSSWGLDDPQNARLWFDDQGDLAAWVVMQSPFWQVDITCRPELEKQLFPRLLEWADQRAMELTGTCHYREAWFITVFSGQFERIRELERRGYADQSDVGEDSWSKVLLRRDSGDPPRVYSPPPGYRARPLRGADEVKAYVELHRVVFGSRNMTQAWRARTLEHTDYDPELDIVVETPDGQLGAFCIGWLRDGVGQIEPLGCRADLRRFALGRVALSEVLQRLVDRGAAQIYVETDNYRNTAFGLYEFFGFKVIEQVLIFRKDYPNSPEP
ncbi:MAG TPA: GNAT family N-acetyltransferase [Anaerolineaceae bacterium]|nr:GNAT family N-acetyltransferase [Anaerolineaceae bacterium]